MAKFSAPTIPLDATEAVTRAILGERTRVDVAIAETERSLAAARARVQDARDAVALRAAASMGQPIAQADRTTLRDAREDVDLLETSLEGLGGRKKQLDADLIRAHRQHAQDFTNFARGEFEREAALYLETGKAYLAAARRLFEVAGITKNPVPFGLNQFSLVDPVTGTIVGGVVEMDNSRGVKELKFPTDPAVTAVFAPLAERRSLLYGVELELTKIRAAEQERDSHAA